MISEPLWSLREQLKGYFSSGQKFYISFLTYSYYMKSETETRVVGLLAVLIGILMIIYPQLVGYLVGVFLIAYGLLKIFS